MSLEIRRLGRIRYEDALALQNQLVDELIACNGRETVLLLEHEPVYTIGRTRDQSSLRSPAHLPHRVIETNRGGQATYHGPGQLVGYPILDLNRRGRDLHAYLRTLESILIELCAAFGVSARRRDGLTGVWVENRKIASLGVGVRKWVSMHGFALNVTAESLDPFASITPCGITDVEMTCLANEAATPIPIESVLSRAASLFQESLQLREPHQRD